MRRIHTTTEVMAVLGGPMKVSRLTGAAYKQVWDWSKAEFFPAPYFFVMWTELVHAHRCYAPPELWRQANVARDKAALLRTAVAKGGGVAA